MDDIVEMPKKDSIKLVHWMDIDQYIGRRLRVLTTNDSHPKIKFEKKLPFPEYQCWFEGKLEKTVSWKNWTSDQCLFSDVDYECRKKWKPKKEWAIHADQIIEFSLLD